MAPKFNRFRREAVTKQLIQMRRLGYSSVVIMDDNLLTDAAFGGWVFDEIERHGLRAIYDGGIYVNFCDRRLVEKMARVCDRVYVALESRYAHSIDKFIRINSTAEDLERNRTRLLRDFREFGIRVSGYFVVGHPRESWADMQATARYAEDLLARGLLDYAALNLATAFPGTPLWIATKRSGSLRLPDAVTPRSYTCFSTMFGNIEHPEVDLNYLREWFHETRAAINGERATAYERGSLERVQFPISELSEEVANG